MESLRDVDCWVFALLMTAALVRTQVRIGEDADAAAARRLVAAILGAATACAAIVSATPTVIGTGGGAKRWVADPEAVDAVGRGPAPASCS